MFEACLILFDLIAGHQGAMSGRCLCGIYAYFPIYNVVRKVFGHSIDAHPEARSLYAMWFIIIIFGAQEFFTDAHPIFSIRLKIIR